MKSSKGIYIYIIAAFFFSYSCKRNCNNFFPIFIDKYNGGIIKETSEIIKVNDTICAINVDIYKYFYIDSIDLIIYGILYKRSGCIYLKPVCPMGNSFILFDFNMKKGEQQLIHFNYMYYFNKNDSILVENSYKLVLEDLFFNKVENDTIYKFRFIDYGLGYDSSDIVSFVGPNVGLMGMYCGDIIPSDSGKERLLMFFGDVFFDRMNENNFIISESATNKINSLYLDFHPKIIIKDIK